MRGVFLLLLLGGLAFAMFVIASLAAWGIRSLGVRARDGASCTDGVEFSEGRVRPTWDWTPRSIR